MSSFVFQRSLGNHEQQQMDKIAPKHYARNWPKELLSSQLLRSKDVSNAFVIFDAKLQATHFTFTFRWQILVHCFIVCGSTYIDKGYCDHRRSTVEEVNQEVWKKSLGRLLVSPSGSLRVLRRFFFLILFETKSIEKPFEI
jgi:hypothetical protein